MSQISEIIGSPKFKLAMTDFEGILKTCLWVGGSAFATKLLELVTSYVSGHNFGAYTFVVMAFVNILGVAIKKYFSDTQEEVVIDEASDSGV